MAIKLNPKMATAHFNVANLYLLQKTYEFAVEHYTLVISLHT